MVVWWFWQPSCCHSIPGAAMTRNSCCVIWLSVALHALPFLSFGQGSSPSGQQAMTGAPLQDCRHVGALPAGLLHHLLNKAQSFMCGLACFSLTAHPRPIYHSQLNNMNCTFPSHLCFSELWLMVKNSEVNMGTSCFKQLRHSSLFDSGFIP